MLSKYAFGWAACFSLAAAGVTQLDPAIRVRNAPGASTADTYRTIIRALHDVRAEKGTKAMEANVTLDKSWDDAVLFAYEKEGNLSDVQLSGSIEIKCTTCYIKGVAKASLTIAENFDAGTIIQQTIGNFTEEVSNLTDAVKDEFVDYVKGVVVNLSDGLDLDDFEFPTFNHTFDLDVPAIPDTDLLFTFDGMEMYVKLATTLNLGATYTLNLYSSNTPVGISVGKDLRAGLIFTIDLILSAEGALEISNGFHLKLEDGIAIHIPLFGNSVGSLDFKGGKFEFLPVTIESGGIVLKAILKVGVQFGIEIASPITIPPIPDISGGIEVAVFAHVAEFITNVTLSPQDKECALKVEQGFQFAIGAAAGATVMIASTEYGPAAETVIPIWYTTLAEVCAIKGKPAATTTAAITARDALRRADLTTTTITTKITHTGVACADSTLVNCPVSLQKTTQYTVTSTRTTAVPSGEKASFPQSISTGAPKVVAFGDNVKDLTATSGAPTSFVPPPPPSSASPSPSDTKLNTQNHDEGDKNDDNLIDGKLKKAIKKTKKPVIIGVSVGVGVLLIALIVAFILWRRSKARKPVPLANSNERYEMMRNIPDHDNPHHEPYSDHSYQGAGPKQPGVGVTSYH